MSSRGYRICNRNWVYRGGLQESLILKGRDINLMKILLTVYYSCYYLHVRKLKVIDTMGSIREQKQQYELSRNLSRYVFTYIVSINVVVPIV